MVLGLYGYIFKPLVRFIWGGGFLILIGGICALIDKKYYHVADLHAA